VRKKIIGKGLEGKFSHKSVIFNIIVEAERCGDSHQIWNDCSWNQHNQLQVLEVAAQLG
jgi:hypothetical protein